ncbi:MAG: SH3 domain-containing protein [Hyphomicrobiaceae bacterium]
MPRDAGTGGWVARASCFRVAAVSLILLLAATLAASAQAPPARSSQQAGLKTAGPSGLPLPRYVSLKADRVNLRQGPGTDYPTAWVYRRAGLPVEVLEEFDTWRKVRDAEGTVGWILQSLLSGRRTALVLPWELKEGSPAPQVPLRYSDSERSSPVAIVEAGVIADVQSCDGVWCLVAVDRYRGYVEQKKLWGVYEREEVR